MYILPFLFGLSINLEILSSAIIPSTIPFILTFQNLLLYIATIS